MLLVTITSPAGPISRAASRLAARQYAARSRIVVLRPNGKGMERIPFNYNKVISANPEQDNFYLRAGDIVLVP